MSFHNIQMDTAKFTNSMTIGDVIKLMRPLSQENIQLNHIAKQGNDVNAMIMKQENIFIGKITKPKTKQKYRRYNKSSMKRSHVRNVIDLDNVCFNPEVEAEYHCNIKPENYAKYLIDPLRDPMFCQFGVSYNKHSQKDVVVSNVDREVRSQENGITELAQQQHLDISRKTHQNSLEHCPTRPNNLE